MDGKLYRSERERMILGVCGGIGNYLGLDPTIIRLIFVIFTVANQIGVVVYLALAIFMPVAPPEEDYAQDQAISFSLDNDQAKNILGIALVFFGAIALLNSFDILWFSWISSRNIFPLALIGLGAYILFGKTKKSEQ